MQKRSILAFAITTALAVVIAVLTLTRMSAPAILPSSDKHQHILAFAALAFPIAASQPRWLIVAAPLFALFGGAIEMMQPYVGRSRDLADWIADLIGIGSGAALGCFVASVTGQRSRDEIAQPREDHPSPGKRPAQQVPRPEAVKTTSRRQMTAAIRATHSEAPARAAGSSHQPPTAGAR